ncbi:hypothetical protein F9K33_06530 [bacterium]|nr:MAG: hypothetical protein F9K33_06530 [bacterium]
MKLLFILFTLFFYSGLDLLSQNHHWQITFNDGLEVSALSLQLEGDSVVFVTTTTEHKTSIESISHLSKIKKSKAGKGMGIGFLGGVVIGGLVGLSTYKEPEPDPEGFGNWDFGPGPSLVAGALIGGLLGMIGGGIVGASKGGAEVHDLSKMTQDEKLKLLSVLTSQNEEVWKAIEIGLSNIGTETDNTIEIRINGKMVLLKKSDLKIVRKTADSIILALPTRLYEKTFHK